MNVGDVVYTVIKPELSMIVSEVDNGWVECLWFDEDNDVASYTFPQAALIVRKAAQVMGAAE